MNPLKIHLRTTVHAPYDTLGRKLTHEEGDERIIEICDTLLAMGSNINPYDPTFPYLGGLTYYVSYANNIFKFISPTDSTGDVPPTPPATNLFWELSSIGAALAAGGAINITSANAIAAALAGTLKVALYRINDAVDGSGDIQVYINAIAPTLFAPRGIILYSNLVMSSGLYMDCGYDVNGEYTTFADYVYNLRDAGSNNDVWQTDGTDTISKMPFDVVRGGGFGKIFKNNRLINVAGTWTADTLVTNVKAEYCTINTAQTGGGGSCWIADADIRRSTISMTTDAGAYAFFSGAGVTVGAFLTGYVGTDATVTVWKAALGRHIGAGWTVDTTVFGPGYSQSSGYVDRDNSTFVGGTLAASNPDGSNIVDITAAPWCAIWGFSDLSASATVDTINGALSYFKYRFFNRTATGAPVTFNDASGNLKLSAASQTLQSGNGDFIEFLTNIDTPGSLSEYHIKNYV